MGLELEFETDSSLFLLGLIGRLEGVGPLMVALRLNEDLEERLSVFRTLVLGCTSVGVGVIFSPSFSLKIKQ